MTSELRPLFERLNVQKSKHITSHVVSWNLALEINTPSSWAWAAVHMSLAQAYNEAMVEFAILHGV